MGVGVRVVGVGGSERVGVGGGSTDRLTELEVARGLIGGWGRGFRGGTGFWVAAFLVSLLSSDSCSISNLPSFGGFFGGAGFEGVFGLGGSSASGTAGSGDFDA